MNTNKSIETNTNREYAEFMEHFALRSKSSAFLLLTLIFLFLSFSFSEATIRFVSHTGSSTLPYTTWETAADSIQKCINISVFGDTIYVANGVYEEQVIMIPGLSLIGAGMDSCFIDTRTLVSSTGFTSVKVANDCLLRGFHILVYYNTDMGYGIVADNNNMILLNRITTGGVGIYGSGSNPDINKNIFENFNRGAYLFNSNAIVKNNFISIPNISGAQGIHLEAFDDNYYPIIDSNYIETFRDGIVKSFGTRSTIRNNTIILKLSGARGITLSYADSGWVYNNLIYAEAGFWGIYNSGVEHLQAYNNYITGINTDNPGAWAITIGYPAIFPDNLVKNNVVTNSLRGIRSGGNFPFQYNNVWNCVTSYSGFTPDTTNISVDPMVVNDDTTKGDLDFHLQKYSALIDAGDPNILDVDGSRSDIGVFGGPFGESYSYNDFPPRAPRNLTVTGVDSSIITLKWNRNTESDFNHYNLYRDTVANFTIDTTKLVSSIQDTFYLHPIPTGAESLYFKLTGVDNQGNESLPSEEVGVLITDVKDEWKPVNNFILYQNYPNPFNPTTRIGYKLKERGYVKLYVYDIKGELVSVLVNQTQEAGYYEVDFDARYSMIDARLASGVYIYQIMVKNENNIPVFSDIKKMLLIK